MYGTDATEQNVRYYKWLQKINKILFCTHVSQLLFVCLFAFSLQQNQITESLALSALGGRMYLPPLPPPCRFFGRCILTCRTLKLILYDFSSNFILNMWPVKFLDQSNNLPTPACLSVTVYDGHLLWNCRFITTSP